MGRLYTGKQPFPDFNVCDTLDSQICSTTQAHCKTKSHCCPHLQWILAPLYEVLGAE